MKINLGTLLGLGLLLTIIFFACGGTYSTINSFKVTNIELDKGSFFGYLKLTGTDGDGNVVNSYSSSYSKSVQSEWLGDVGICYNLFGFGLPNEQSSKFHIINSFPVSCQQK